MLFVGTRPRRLFVELSGGAWQRNFPELYAEKRFDESYRNETIENVVEVINQNLSTKNELSVYFSSQISRSVS